MTIARRATAFTAPLTALLLSAASTATAQTTGSIVGRVTESQSGAPLQGVDVTVQPMGRQTLTDEEGRFVFAGLPAGTYTVRIELLSYRPLTMEQVVVRAGRRTNLSALLVAAAIDVEPLVVEAERIPLIEPEVSETHHILLGRELIELPADNVEEAVELTTGVADGHFRGGRIGQEVYVVDGLAVKNQLEASSQGFGLEFAPSALAEIDVTTGGFGAEYGSALSGVVNFVTRKGDRERWESRVSLSSDHPAPDEFSAGFTELSVSTGGPLRFLGSGTTLFADVLLQGMLDADARAEGLTCLAPQDAEPQLADAILLLRNDPATAHLYCPFSSDLFPHQQGDKFIGFLRLDRPFGQGANLTASLLRNRFQRELYTSEFKYNPAYQLGQRLTGTLGTLVFDWATDAQGKAFHLTGRSAVMVLDRYLGVLDPESVDGRDEIAGFGFGEFEFLGEGFVKRPLSEQRASGRGVPGYVEPSGSIGSPFGPAAEGIFVTEGTPGIANWTSQTMWAGDLTGELLMSSGSSLRAGASARFYTIENYERPFAYAPDSVVNFDRYNPTTLAGFAELRIPTAEVFAATLGARFETFRSGLTVRPDTAERPEFEFDPGWKTVFVPRVGFAGAFPNSAGETSFRFNFSRLAQPPDFRFFIDTTIGDSLRTDIRLQGNPNLAFEKGRAFELGISHLVAGKIGVSLTGFRKEYRNLVSGSLQAGGVGTVFTTGDKGTSQGVELTLLGQWPFFRFRAGYALQKATGLAAKIVDDAVDPDAQFEEFPLAHDRRHTLDFLALGGRSVGWAGTGWGGSLAVSVRSGIPLDPRAEEVVRLPWTALVGLRITRELGALPFCDRCRSRLLLDGRNIIGRDNVIALRRDTGGLGPPPDQVLDAGDDIQPDTEPIPRESRFYNPLADLDADGLITVDELRTARMAAALDRNDPSLFFGDARQVRLGVEVEF